VLAWGQYRDPPDAFADVLGTLHELCLSGSVHAIGHRCETPSRTGLAAAGSATTADRPFDALEPIPADDWAELYFDSDGKQLRSEGLFSVRLRRHRAWTSVRYSQADLVEKWPKAGARAFVKAAGDRYWSDREQKAVQRGERMAWLRESINRFADRQRLARRWIPFVDVADMCARAEPPVSIALEEEARALAYRRLAESTWRGEFERAGRSQVLLLHPDSRKSRRLTHDYFHAMIDTYGATNFRSNSLLVREILRFCWLPRDLCQQWFIYHGFEWPDAFNTDKTRSRLESLEKEPKVNLGDGELFARKKGHPIEAMQPSDPRRRAGGRQPGSGEIDDDEHVLQMLRLLATNKAASVFAAAGQIADYVTGASEVANQRRLARKFKKKFGITNLPLSETWEIFERKLNLNSSSI
jgi:hypothetical protein